MKLKGLHETEILENQVPYRIVQNSMKEFSYPPHWHNAVEIVYCAEGNCEVEVNNKSYGLGNDEVLVIPAGEIHRIISSGSNGNRYFLQIDYALLLAYHIDMMQLCHPETRSINNADGPLYTAVIPLIARMIDEDQKKLPHYDLVVGALFLELAALLGRSCVQHTQHTNSDRTVEVSRLDKAFEYIHQNYQCKMTLADAAFATGFSEYHFSRYFKKATGRNFHRYLNEYRIRRFEALLSDSGVTLTEAALASGFNSISTFNRLFRSIKGCSPSEYLQLRR